MLNLSEEDGLNLVEAARTVQTSDCDTFVAVFERSARRRNDTVPMLLTLAPNFSGGLWRDLKFDIRPKDSFGRIAIVDDQKPEKRGTRIFDRLFRAQLNKAVVPLSAKLSLARSKVLNLQSKLRARAVIDTHYQLSPALFMSFLDPYNQYTCGYFKNTDDLYASADHCGTCRCQGLCRPDAKGLRGEHRSRRWLH